MAESKRYEIEVSAKPAYLADQSDPAKNQYVFAYTITITYGGKTIEAWDLSPDLPDVFRQIFGEIEAIAGEAAATVPPVPDAGP